MLTRLKAAAASFADTAPGRLIRKVGEDQAPNQAVLVAWNTFFALFPIVLVMLAVLGLVLNLVGVGEDKIQSFVVQMFPDKQIQDQITPALAGVKRSSGLFVVVGFAGLVWAGANLFGALERAFDVIFHAKPRDFIHGKLMAVGMIFVFTILAGVAVGSAAVLPLLGRIPGIPSFLTTGLVFVLQPVVGIASGALLFGAIYYVVPNKKIRLSEVWPGALLAGVGFEALSLAFPLYLRVTGGSKQYGATFGLLFVMLNYFYFVGLITLVGAELNAVLFPVPVEQPGQKGNPLPKPEAEGRAVKEPEAVGDAAGRAKEELSGAEPRSIPDRPAERGAGGRRADQAAGSAPSTEPRAVAAASESGPVKESSRRPQRSAPVAVTGPKRLLFGAVGTVLGMVLGRGGRQRPVG